MILTKVLGSVPGVSEELKDLSFAPITKPNCSVYNISLYTDISTDSGLDAAVLITSTFTCKKLFV